MNALNVGERAIALDKDGYLADRDDWSVEVATALAAAEDIELSPSTGKSSNCCGASTTSSSSPPPPGR